MRLKELTKDALSTMIEGVAIRYRVKCDELNNILIRQTLQSEFGHLLVLDFNNAFIKHCSGAFMISEKQEGNKPYGDLSAQFICLVINKHKEYKQKENAKPKLIIPVERQLPMSKESKEDFQRKNYEIIDSWVKEKGDVPLFANWNESFHHMERTGLIDLSNEEKQMFLDNVIYDLKTKRVELRRKGFNCDHLTKILSSEGLMKMEVRKRFIIKYFTNLINKEKNN